MTATPPDSTAVEQWMKSIGYEIARGGWQKLHSSGRKFEYLSDEQASFFYQVCRAGETAARVDERQLALSELDADNQIQQRDFDLPKDFLDGWQDAISTAAKQRDERLHQLKAGEQAHE